MINLPSNPWGRSGYVVGVRRMGCNWEVQDWSSWPIMGLSRSGDLGPRILFMNWKSRSSTALREVTGINWLCSFQLRLRPLPYNKNFRITSELRGFRPTQRCNQSVLRPEIWDRFFAPFSLSFSSRVAVDVAYCWQREQWNWRWRSKKSQCKPCDEARLSTSGKRGGNAS